MANEGQLKPDVDGNARLGSDCVWLLRSCVELKGEGQVFFILCRAARQGPDGRFFARLYLGKLVFQARCAQIRGGGIRWPQNASVGYAMFEWFVLLGPVWQALLATLFTYAVTAAGGGLVFCVRGVGRTALDAMMGFAAGVMTAASFWSLLSPAMELAGEMGMNVALTAFCGLMAGGGLLWAGDWAYGRLAARGGPATEGARRRLMLMAGMTLHNIPEGMAVGVAFGSLAHGLDGATLPAACMLAVGVGIQNFPEGAAVSLPLLRDGLGRGKAFFLGQLSAVVEPLAGVAGAVLVLGAQRMLPGMLSFAAGAMLYVAIAELIPESLANERRGLMAVVTLAGFGVMMVLDVALG